MGRKEITKTLPFDKLPPQNTEAEQAVLGAMLLNERIVPDIVDSLDPSLFYKDSHKEVFQVVSDLFNKNRNIDIVTVANELKSRGKLDSVGGNLYLTQLVDNVPSAANASSYASIIREKGTLRHLMTTAFDIVNLCHEPQESVDELLDKAEKMIFEISKQNTDEGIVVIKDVIHDTIEKIEGLFNNKSHITGISTGFKGFDRKTSGLHGGELIIIAGRPSMGKSSFAANIAEHVAVDQKVPVLFFSAEMSKESITQRFLCTRAKVDAQKVRTGFFPQEEWPRLTMAAGELAEAPLYIDDSSSTLYAIRAKARRMRAKHGVELIIIDYLQLLSKGGRVESRQYEISEISRSLKMLSSELGIPIIALSQLSRDVEKREDHRPRMSDLRESGSIEQDADLVVFLYREEYYNPGKLEAEGRSEIIISKQRNGPLGVIEMAFIKEYMMFAELDKFHGE